MPFFKIDIHTHILPKDLPDLKTKYGYGGWVQLEHHKPGKANMIIDGKFFREIDENCWSPEARIAEMDKHGVDVQVLSTIPVLFAYAAKPEHCLDFAQYLNNHIANVVSEYPKRFIGLGTLPMQAPELAIQELRRCMELGLAGVEIGSHVGAWNLDAPELFPVFEEAEKLGAVVFVHPWDMMAKERMPNYWMPWLVGMPAETTLAICCMIFGNVLERLPKLKICFAHGGGSFACSLGRIEHGAACRPDLVKIRCKKDPRDYLDRIWVDTLTHDPDVLCMLSKTFGANRLMLGSDYPFPLGEQHPGKMIEEMDVDDRSKAMWLAENALELFNVKGKLGPGAAETAEAALQKLNLGNQ